LASYITQFPGEFVERLPVALEFHKAPTIS
jgi:hypothetical protein